MATANQVRYQLWTSPSGGTYRVSSGGHLSREIRPGIWRETGGAINGSGYKNFGGVRAGKRWMKYVHRLVAELFVPNPNNLKQVDHRDRNRLNNAAANLRWATAQQNAENKVGRGCQEKNGRWVASIRVRGCKKHLGTFATEAEAHECYLRAKRQYHDFFPDKNSG